MITNQWALITGASSGIGKELAIIFAKNKCNIVLVARAKNVLEDLAQELTRQYSIQTVVIAKDLSQQDAVKEICNELKEKNISVQHLVNNAGFGTHGAFAETDLNETLNMLTVNISALTELTYLLLPDMLKQKNGKIMNVSSVAAFQAGPSMAVYCATKAYVLSFSEALADELKNSGVTVTALCPGATTTAFQERAKMMDIKLMNSAFPLMSAQAVAEIGFKAMLRGKSIAVCGLLNKVFAFSTRLTPRRIATHMAGILLR